LSDRITINLLGASAEQCGNHQYNAEAYGRDDIRRACLSSRATGPECEHGNKGYQPKLA
jgi:hypothetical protein